MCGIAGIFGLRGREKNFSKEILAMSGRIRHRGPDGEGLVFFKAGEVIPVFTDETPKAAINVDLPYSPNKATASLNEKFSGCFAHRRLSILDLTASGHQPMCTADKRYWITYNGEVYNYKILRSELEKSGIKFFSNSDTEVLLYAYVKWGSGFPEKISGMFSLVIYDSVEQKIFAARDRFGVKPFYYSCNEKQFVFSSEQKAFLGLEEFKPELNPNAFVDFFYFDTLEREEEGFLKNILELKPGHFLQVDLKSASLRTQSYYELRVESGLLTNLTHEQIVDRTRELVKQAVLSHLQSDVQVGSCLSGGLDSSAIVALAAAALPYPVQLFTASFKGFEFDETRWSELAAKQCGGMQHLVFPDAGGLFDNLEDLIYSQDIPLFSTSTFAQHSVMGLAASKNVKVVLDGQGGDELFGGYPNHYSAYWKELLRSGNLKLLKSEMAQAPSGMKSLRQLIKLWMADPIVLKMGNAGGRSLVEKLRPELSWLNQDFVRSSHAISKTEQAGGLNDLLLREFTGVRLKGYLKCEDRASMWHSVESRTPFTDDHQLVEWVFSLPPNLKIKDGRNKYLLRKAMEGLVPDEIIARKDKLGYVTPNQQWLMENLEKVKEIVYDTDNSYFNIPLLQKQFENFVKGRVSPNDHRLFKWISFSVWRRKFGL